MALTPPLNHWWHVTLRVSARGVTTGPMPCEAGLAEIELDLVAHRAVVRTSEGATRDFGCTTGSRSPRSTSACSRPWTTSA